ncbi:unnamed protein product [Microthlaspi erraticum]|uniref:Bulb-type lectin domain-containing protein n=1 Tax=Microthlaspi erraticum TaxID=1685480 RepID=A0A6D2JWF1_9BRAS|nr:unnamed protein product [Microthlaspi erraticum]
MRLLFFFILVLELSSKYESKILPAEPYKLSSQRNMFSPSKFFVLGLFRPGADERWYLGIWHHRFPEQVVWVANRDTPLSEPIGTLEIMDANIVLLDEHGTRVWWTNGTSTTPMGSPLIGELLDSGNLVLRHSKSGGFLWQSFDFPTDALVSEMKLGWDAKSNLNRVLKSWRSFDDPSSGEFTFGVERHGLVQSFIRQKGVPTFRDGPWNTITDGKIGENLTYATYSILVTEDEASYFFRLTNDSFFSILRLDYGGRLKQSTWIPKALKPKEHTIPEDMCGWYNKCGANALCGRDASRENCDCLPGFKPRPRSMGFARLGWWV